MIQFDRLKDRFLQTKMSVNIPESIRSLVPYDLKPCIPKIIHQTYKSIEQLPEIWKDTPDSWTHHHKTWTYMFWSDADCRRLVKEKFPWFLSVYDGYEHNIQRADAVRPMMLYVFGGLYVDCDIQPIKSFDDLFYQDHDLYLIRTPNVNYVTNCVMASKAGVKFWLRYIEEMKIRAESPLPLYIVGKHFTVMFTTGPWIINYMYNLYERDIDVKFLPRELILPSECGICVPKPCSTKLGYTRLLEGSSWVGYDTVVFNTIMCNYKYILALFALSFLLYSFSVYFAYPSRSDI